jgi:hypothetical protein
MNVNATSPAGAVVAFTIPTATDNCGATVSSDVAPGSTLPIGIITVTVTATDGVSSTQCSFTVNVKGAAQQLVDLTARVNALPNVKPATKNALIVKLNAAAAALRVNNTLLACISVQDFNNFAKAQAEKKLIPAGTATSLIADGTRIRAVIGCAQ